jgi:hypothetical protein
VVALTTVFGTGGIAVAGGLPAPLQTVVADVARALPVPFHVPYPKISTEGVSAVVANHPDRGPDDAEVEVGPHEVIDTSVSPVPRPEMPATGSDLGGPHPDPTRDKDDDRARCDLEELVADRDRLDADEVRELRDQIQEVCGFDLVDPPGWAEGFLTDDRDRDDRRDRDDDRRDEERRDGDRGRDETGGRDGDFGSSESEDSGEASGDGSDEQEERHHDEDDGDDRSSDDEWRDRHD